LAILAASILAILSKALLPSNVNIDDFNSAFVKMIGFPAVASLYFITIYTQSAVATQLFGRKAKLSATQIGIRFGTCFGLIFLMGMQEVVVKASPFSEWGFNYVKYEFFMGIGEAAAVLLLCIATAKFTITNNKQVAYGRENRIVHRLLMAGFITLTFTIERVIAYRTGLISSDIAAFPVPCYGWTILFGITLGCCYIILLPIFVNDKNAVGQSFKLTVATLGLSWIILNSFIGWIIKGAMIPALIRSGLDTAVFFITVLIGTKYFYRHTPE
jgi:hypothetical protein